MLEYIFDGEILKRIDSCDFFFESNDFPQVGRNLILRPLSLDDYQKGFLNVLAQLTDIGTVDEKSFVNRFNSMKTCVGSYFIIVVEDTDKNLIVASATLVVEQKFIHSCGTRGRIEDVVVSNDYRKKDLGKKLVSTLIKLSEQLECYKVTLECKDSLLPFYESLGLQKEANNSNYLQKRFHIYSACS